jgi:uncharacterized protein (DUF849 family)
MARDHQRPRSAPHRFLSIPGDLVILTCAIGSATPQTPEELGAEAGRARDAGASVIHVQGQSFDELRVINAAVLAQAPDVLVAYGPGLAEALEALRPDLVAIDMRTAEPPAAVIALLETMNRQNIRPVHHCSDSGHLASLDPLLEADLLDTPLRISMVLGVNGGIRPTPRNLVHMVDQIPSGPDGTDSWELIAPGREFWPLAAVALSLGGDIRVGFGDDHRLPNGTVATSNGELVDACRRLIELTGRRVATPEQAQAALGVPRTTAV